VVKPAIKQARFSIEPWSFPQGLSLTGSWINNAAIPESYGFRFSAEL
jgi:hypothetical protein